MTACSCDPHALFRSGSDSAPRRRRIAVAAGISALVHATLMATLSGGGSPTPGTPRAAALAARLLQVSPPVVSEELPARDEPVGRPPLPGRLAAPPVPSRPKVAAEARVTDGATPVTRPTEGSALSETLDTTYYAARQLDIYPALTSPLDLDRLARSAGSSGRALLLVSIDASGAVNEVSMVETGPARSLDEARRAFMSARFTPAYRNGRAVRSRVLVQIDYGEERAAKD